MLPAKRNIYFQRHALYYSLVINSISVQLTQVVERMTQANANLEQLRDNAQPVHDIARMWKESTAHAAANP